MVSGKNLISAVSDEAKVTDLKKDTTYAVVAIEKENHSPMPACTALCRMEFNMNYLITVKAWIIDSPCILNKNKSRKSVKNIFRLLIMEQFSV